jgi:hypothetical protein
VLGRRVVPVRRPVQLGPLSYGHGKRELGLLTGRWRILQHVTAGPGRIGDIARAALVPGHFENGYIT